MPATHKAVTTTRRATRTPDVVALLKADHAEVKKAFGQYQKLADGDAPGEQRQALAAQICQMLKVHTQVEEELFYPVARSLLGDEADLVDEADVEHAGAKHLMAEILAMQPDDDHYNAKVKVLSEYIDHHVQEEEKKLFPKLKKAGLDAKALGEDLAHRKEELMGKPASAEARH